MIRSAHLIIVANIFTLGRETKPAANVETTKKVRCEDGVYSFCWWRWTWRALLSAEAAIAEVAYYALLAEGQQGTCIIESIAKFSYLILAMAIASKKREV